tara:strand:- start:695 stop:1513 length:819 start_codon:yes stop_codon:yes gene_type:complete
MAETLTYENSDEVTTVENLSSDEQDSLQVGQAMQEAQDNLLAGKYKDAQELEKAYVELQKKLGDQGSEDSSEAGNPEDSQQVDSEEGEQKEEEAKEDTGEDGILDTLWKEATSKDSYTKETVDKLNELTPVELADMHLRYREQVEKQYAPKAISDADVTELKNIAGGEQGYNDMISWANNNLNEQEVKMFDAVMEKGDPLAAFFAVRSLAYRWEDSRGVDGKMLTGTAPKSDGSQFRSQAEVVQAMSDPRYERDSAYRNDIMKKLERSNVNF